jgi:nudix-type nucleoside diphosphatase (YffH/AdpP family)
VKRVVVEEVSRVYDGFFKVDEARLRYERFNGAMSETVRRLKFERGDSVAVLLYNPETARILLVNQFKYPTYEKGPGWITETLAGMIDVGEDPEDAARREILEETGYSVRELKYISTFYLSPGGSSERIFLYLAEVADCDKVQEGGGLTEESEDIASVELNLEDAREQVRTGEIVDAKTIIAIYSLENHVHEKSATAVMLEGP